jgi:outer membrane protein
LAGQRRFFSFPNFMPNSTSTRWVFNTGVVLALIALFILHFTNRPPRLAYVDSSRLLHDYQGMIDARSTYNLHKQEWQRNLDTLRAETARGFADYQRNRATLTPALQQDTETRLRILRQQYVDYQSAIQTKDGEEQQHLTQQVLDSSNAFLRRYGARNNYDMILLTAEGDNLAYAKSGLDVTVPILKELNAKYTKQGRGVE